MSLSSGLSGILSAFSLRTSCFLSRCSVLISAGLLCCAQLRSSSSSSSSESGTAPSAGSHSVTQRSPGARARQSATHAASVAALHPLSAPRDASMRRPDAPPAPPLAPLAAMAASDAPNPAPPSRTQSRWPGGGWPGGGVRPGGEAAPRPEEESASSRAAAAGSTRVASGGTIALAREPSRAWPAALCGDGAGRGRGPRRRRGGAGRPVRI
mmetsp:Transcript_8048/g.26566  ORF Transcript_8048/g.26566 Transcript_8048/m.26566 type:complete len:211 (-) Transcript_8048:110-742(-)